jgi:phosphoribosylformylglycinamidine synthase
VDLAAHAGQAISDEALLFGESGARAVVTVAPEKETELLALAHRLGVPAAAAGTVGNEGGEFIVKRGRALISRPVDQLRAIYFEAIPRRMAAVGR